MEQFYQQRYKPYVPKIKYDSKVPYLFQALKIRRSLNKDNIIIIVGEKRIGKNTKSTDLCCHSYAGIKIGERMDNKFDVDKQVFFDVKPFLRLFSVNN